MPPSLTDLRIRWLAALWVAQISPTALNLAILKRAEAQYCAQSARTLYAA